MEFDIENDGPERKWFNRVIVALLVSGVLFLFSMSVSNEADNGYKTLTNESSGRVTQVVSNMSESEYNELQQVMQLNYGSDTGDVTPDSRVCEVELPGDIEGGDIYSTKVSTNKIKIVRELSVSDFLKIGTPGAITKAAMTGSDEISDEMIAQLKPYYRMLIADLGADQHRNGLVHDIDWYVRRVLAQFGTKEHKDILVHDEDSDVRMVIAKYGDDEHRDILVNDKSADVRAVVAQYGNDEHRKLLASDKSPHVRQYIERSLR